jgi:hypothetical protein
MQIQVTKLLNFSAAFHALAIPREMCDTANMRDGRSRTLDNQFNRTELGLKCSSRSYWSEELGKARVL